ncbi:MAG TPA: hypothetical protein VNU01_05265, partial [Egibacteraceae bacterium]|nr:hypothetical protein [Egibacteraceae bacterium]
LEERVLLRVEDANVGSILGIGFPSWTGGAAQFVDQYPGGVGGFVQRCESLAAGYGERFRATSSALSAAAAGETLRAHFARGVTV